MANRRRMKSLRGQQAKKARDMYIAGFSVRQICCDLGVIRGQVDRCLAIGGIQKRTIKEALALRAKSRTDEERERDEAPRRGRRLELPERDIVSLYAGGMSENAIARHFGVSRSPICRILSESNIKRRGRSEAEALKWSQMPEGARRAQVYAAHHASNGKKRSKEELKKRALSRETRWARHTTKDAVSLMEFLASLGVRCGAEVACGPYNIDVAVAGTIAVELHGGGWHMSVIRRAKEPERIKYLLDRGWQCLTVWTDKRRHPLSMACAKYIVAMLDELRGDHPPTRQNRVIRGDGKPWPERRLDVD